MSWLATLRGGKCSSARGLSYATLAFCLIAAPCGAPTQVTGPREESEVKAAMLFNFVRFVDWPDPVNYGTLTIGLLADPAFIAVFERMFRGRTVNGRPVVVKPVGRPSDAGDCQVVFVSRALGSQWRFIRDALAGRSVLTVSDMPDFSLRGGIIGLFEENRRLRFEINLTAARSAGLRPWAQLLKLGRVVEIPPPKAGK